jgi:hypothetical protein
MASRVLCIARRRGAVFLCLAAMVFWARYPVAGRGGHATDAVLGVSWASKIGHAIMRGVSRRLTAALFGWWLTLLRRTLVCQSRHVRTLLFRRMTLEPQKWTFHFRAFGSRLGPLSRGLRQPAPLTVTDSSDDGLPLPVSLEQTNNF